MIEPRSPSDDLSGQTIQCASGGGRPMAYQYDAGYRELAHLPSGLGVIFRTVHSNAQEDPRHGTSAEEPMEEASE
jgi:hypothetical protein